MRYKLGLFIVTVFLISCHAQEINQSKLTSWLQEYREAKSEEWSRTLRLVHSKEFQKKYLHKDFDTVIGDREERKFFVLADDFLFESVVLDNDEYYKEKYGNQCYYVQGKETYLGEVVNGKYKPYENKKILPSDYLVIKVDDGFLLMMEWMLSDFYILEKDVPALLERLKKTGEKF